MLLLSIYKKFWQGNPVDILIDPGATNNFIVKHTVDRLKLPLYANSHTWDLQLANTNQHCNQACKITLSINTYTEELTFDVANLPKHKIILGLPWLHHHNPTVDWPSSEIHFIYKMQPFLLANGHCTIDKPGTIAHFYINLR